MNTALSFYMLGLITISTTLCTFTIPAKSVQACGWWGDGEIDQHNTEGFSNPDGVSIPQSLTHLSSKLPGRIGYGIAVPDPDRALPYLQATRGRQINRIAELKIFGFETVIDLGTPAKTALLHQSETEALGMRYISIPVEGFVPSQEQTNDFTQKVIDASSSMLLVYAPNSALLGTMWAAHRINLGAPVEFSIKQGRKLGMQTEQEAALRIRLGAKK